MRKVVTKRRVRTIWISDTHLGSKGCKAAFLLDFLKAHRCETLYLVGDIIDGWRMQKSIYWPQTHSNVLRRILTLSKRGTKVVYVTGNHDEFLRKFSNNVFGNIHLVDRAVHETRKGKRLLVIHGDEYDVIVRYHKWIALLGDAAYNLLLVLNRWYNHLRLKFGYGYWSLSAYVKQRVKQAVSFIGDYEQALADECKRGGFDGVVCGHIHHAEIRKIDGVTYHNCGDWVESCTALIETFSGSVELVHWIEELADTQPEKKQALVAS
jgi:UDP-2,3-diacylglucosamine pyrophosphatase LpxH